MSDPKDFDGNELDLPDSPFSFDSDDRDDIEDDDDGQPDFRGADEIDIDLVMDVAVTMQVVLGSSRISVANLLKLNRGSVVKLDTKVGDPVDVVVNGRVIARGEIVVLDKEEQRFGVTLTEVATPGSNLKAKKSKAA